MIIDYAKIVATIALAVVGWIIAHYFTGERAISSKRRDLVTNHLINSYRVLANEVSHRKLTPEREKLLEDILSDIQLFGSLEQVKLAKALANEMAETRHCELDPLLNSIRNDLRAELNLKFVVGNLRWLRLTDD